MNTDIFNTKSSSEHESTEEISEDVFLNSLEVVESGGRPLITCEFEKFDKYFRDENISDAQKTELLQVLWNFVVASMSFNLGIHPLQLATQSCGKLKEKCNIPTSLGSNLVDSGNTDQIEETTLKEKSDA